jgi:hypothetical protein
LIKDQKILTDRFRKIYAELIEKGEIIPGTSGDKSPESFAEKIGTKDFAIGLWLQGNSFIPHDVAFKFCQVYGIAIEYMFGDITNVIDIVSKKAGNIIWIEDIEFFCGNGDFDNQFKNFQRYDDHSVNGEFWAFRATGDSMERTIYSGDIVFSTKLEKPDYINRNDICAIVKLNQAIIKRVKDKIYDKKTGLLTHLTLLSDNLELYPKEIKIPIKLINHIFKVVEIKTKNTDRKANKKA